MNICHIVMIKCYSIMMIIDDNVDEIYVIYLWYNKLSANNPDNNVMYSIMCIYFILKCDKECKDNNIYCQQTLYVYTRDTNVTVDNHF